MQQLNANDVLELPLEICMYVRERNDVEITPRDESKSSLDTLRTAHSMLVEDMFSYTSDALPSMSETWSGAEKAPQMSSDSVADVDVRIFDWFD